MGKRFFEVLGSVGLIISELCNDICIGEQSVVPQILLKWFVINDEFL